MDCHEFQRDACRMSPRPVINIGSKEDPSNLAELYDAINLDLLEYDPHTGTTFKTQIKNFVQGNARNIPYRNSFFGTAVIGEVLEHCTEEAGKQVLSEANRVIYQQGCIILTFPLDCRPPEIQHDKHLLMEWDVGITSYHQTVWTDDRFVPLIESLGLRVAYRQALEYPFLRDYAIPGYPQGWGMALMRIS